MPPRNVGSFGDDAAELRVDHLVVPQVDATVGDVTGAGPKENQVAGFRVAGANVVVSVVLGLGRPGQRLADGLFEDVLSKAGAVKGAWAVTTVNVRLPQLGLGGFQDRCVSPGPFGGSGRGGVAVALLLKVAVPDPTGCGLLAVSHVIVEVLHAVFLGDVPLLCGVPGGVRVVFQIVGLFAEGHVAGRAPQVVGPAGRALANVLGIGHATGAVNGVRGVGRSCGGEAPDG